MPRNRLANCHPINLWGPYWARYWVFLLLLWLPGAIRGEDGTVLRFPVMGKTRFPSGLKMEVDTRWVEAQGYRPIRITLGAVNGLSAPADIAVRVEITVHAQNDRDEAGDRTIAYVTLPEGKVSTTTTVPLLQESLWTRIEIKSFDDSGREIKDLSDTFTASASARRVNQYYGWDQDAITFLVIHHKVPPRSLRTAGTTGATPAMIPKAAPAPEQNVANEIPDIRALALQIPDPISPFNTMVAGGAATTSANDPVYPLTDSQILDWLATRSNFEMLPPDDVPLQWLELTSFDFIVLSLDEAEELAKTSPRRWEAVREWTRAGGNLIVYGAADASRRSALDRLLKEEDREERWRPLMASKNNASVEYVQESYNNWGNQPIEKIDISKDRPTNGFFTAHARESGLGAVLAIEQSDVFPGTRRQWTALINSLPGWRALWSVRNGVSLSNSNIDSYWHFAIPGLGMAPVLLFVGLISVFVIFLGPVNYGFLKRRKQLSLLIFTVPIGALLTIFSLMAYAILGDGFSTRVRVWSVTDLDQKTGAATSWSHQTYYAGIPPWSGLAFPKEAAVYPVDQLPERMGYQNRGAMQRASRTVHWDDAQNLRSGYISSRTLSQMVVIHPTRTEAKVLVEEGRATNQLGTPILLLAWRGEDGVVQTTRNLAPGETKALSAFGEADREAFKEMFVSKKPQLLEGFDVYAYSTAMTRGNRNLFVGTGRNYSSTAEGDSVLMETLKACETPDSPAGGLAPRSYVAVVATSPMTSLGSRGAVEVMSFHVIRGRW